MKISTISALLVAVVAMGTAMNVPRSITPGCQIRWNDFEEVTSTPTFWASVYRVNIRASTRTYGNRMSLYTKIDNDTYRLRVAHWSLDVGAEVVCIGHDVQYSRIDDGFAVLRKSFGFITFTYMSRNPKKYILNSACFAPLDEDGVCLEPVILVMIPDKRPDSNGDGIPDGPLKLTGTQWSDIDKDLRECVGVSFDETSEPLSEWIWDGEDCPFSPVPDV